MILAYTPDGRKLMTRKIFYDEWGDIIILQQCQKCFTRLSVNGEGICLYCGYDNYGDEQIEK